MQWPTLSINIYKQVFKIFYCLNKCVPTFFVNANLKYLNTFNNHQVILLQKLLLPPHNSYEQLSHYLWIDQLQSIYCPVGWGYRIHWLHLCKAVRPPNECPGYDTKQSDGEATVMLGPWGIWSTPLLPSLPDPLWPGVVALDKGPIYGLNRTNGILMLNWIVWLNWIAWNRNVFDN